MPLAQVQTRLRSHNNLLVVVVTAAIGGLELSIIGVVWQPFVLSLGASMSFLGLLTSLGGVSGIIPTLISPVGGWLADRSGRRRLLLIASLSSIAAYGLYTLAGVGGLVLALVPGIISLSLAALARPASSALVGESVGAGSYGRAYSIVTFASIVPGILAPLGAGWLAERLGYTSIFPLALVAEVISFIIIARYLQETRRIDFTGIDWAGLKRLLRRAWLPPKGLISFFVASAMDAFSWGLGWGLLYGLLNKEFGFNPGQLGILSSIMSITWAATQLPIGRFIDRLGAKAMMALSEALGPPLLLIWMTQSRFEIFAASMPLFALTAALWLPARSTFITHAVEPERRAETFGRLSAFVGLVAFPSALVGGMLYDHFGFAAPILANLIGSFLALLVIVFLVREPRSGAAV